MATAAEIATRYFEATGRHDLEAAVAVWQPGGTDRPIGDREVTAPQIGQLSDAAATLP